MLKIAVISVYFGKLPEYKNLWLKSCEYNPAVDFYLVTDQCINRLPKNVRVIKCTLSDIKDLIESSLEREICLSEAYKLCDYKPMYGLVFRDILVGYDYWGHCDMDMIFGNLSDYFEKYNLSKYDRFLHLGHLSLYRNTDKNNNTFRLPGAKCGTWEKVIATDANCLFDEWDGVYGIYKDNHIPMFEERIFADISQIYDRFRLALDDINYEHQVFYWQNGGVYRTYWKDETMKTDEFIYIHFKRRHLPGEDFEVDDTDAFYIGPSGFSIKKHLNTPEMDEINQINPFKGRQFEAHELKAFKKAQEKERRIRRLKKVFRV